MNRPTAEGDVERKAVIKILHITPFRLPFSVDWNVISEFPEYAEKVINFVVDAPAQDGGLQISHGYKKIYRAARSMTKLSKIACPIVLNR